jgi:hypothetical protein
MRLIRPIQPLSIPEDRARALRDEALDMADSYAPGLPPSVVWAGVKAWAIYEATEAEGDVVADGSPLAWALFIPEEYISGEGDGHMGSLMTKAADSPALDVRDVLDHEPLTIARAIRRALS